ncbi:MAG: DUF1800 domain-containing protein [Anaerolineae bacterium]|nr:DUF1800 domain-containing protein [Anaerolineae bacterium]
MPTSRRDFLRFSASALIAAAAGSGYASAVAAQQGAETLPAARDPELHFLNRITYGPRPEEVERIRQIGVEAYLDEQLHPDSVDDSAMDERLRQFPILFMDRRTVHILGTDGRVWFALIRGMIERAAASRRQLYERMVEFWTDHFNVSGDDYVPDMVLMHREVIRRHALGKFRDLVIGTAQHPAMLYYLDQAYSDKEHPNENYARELLELHTLGVDGGYSEEDVKEAARALTGWTVHDGTETGFFFDAEMHDFDDKFILGHEMPEGRGIEDGLHLISIVANHPSTARFVCRKLCVRFVSDNPPESLVESAAQVFRETGGEIAPVLRHILLSAEFQASAGQKLRRPLEFFVGAIRATGTTVRDDWFYLSLLEDLAQVPYQWSPPNGYPDVAGAWLGSSSLLARWNTAMTLTHGAYSEQDTGMTTQLRQRLGSPESIGQMVDAVAAQVFGVPLPQAERAQFVAYASDGGDEQAAATPRVISDKLGTLYGLMLASPLYQWK